MIKRFLLLLILVLAAPVSALEPSAELKAKLQNLYPGSKFRMDGALERAGRLWLPFVPKDEIASALPRNDNALSINDDNGDIALLYKSPDDELLFSNNWIFLPVKDNTVKSFDFLDHSIQAQILQTQIVQSLLVPKQFKLPRDLAITAGRLPLSFRDVELATDREAEFLRKLKEESKKLKFRIFSYDYMAGKANLTTIAAPDPGVKEAKVITQEAKALSNILSLVSSVRKFDDSLYIVDYNRAKIFEVEKMIEAEKIEDEAKPVTSIKVDEFMSLGEDIGLKDFTFSINRDLIYCLSNKKSELYIYGAKDKKLIKTIHLGANSSQLLAYSRSASEEDYLLALAKGSNEIYVINSFNHKLVKTIKLSNVEASHLLQAMVANSSAIFTASKISEKSGSILQVDWVTGDVEHEFEIDLLPEALTVSADGKYLYVLGSKPESDSIDSGKDFVIKLNIAKEMVEAEIDLAPDIVQAKSMTVSPMGQFLLIGSSGSDTLAVVDLENFTLVKKINIASKSNLVFAL